MENPADPPRPLRPVPFSSAICVFSCSGPRSLLVFPSSSRARPCASRGESSRLLATPHNPRASRTIDRLTAAAAAAEPNVWRESVGAFEFEAIGRAPPKPAERRRSRSSAGDLLTGACARSRARTHDPLLDWR